MRVAMRVPMIAPSPTMIARLISVISFLLLEGLFAARPSERHSTPQSGREEPPGAFGTPLR